MVLLVNWKTGILVDQQIKTIQGGSAELNWCGLKKAVEIALSCFDTVTCMMYDIYQLSMIVCMYDLGN